MVFMLSLQNSMWYSLEFELLTCYALCLITSIANEYLIHKDLSESVNFCFITIHNHEKLSFAFLYDYLFYLLLTLARPPSF